ncbi:TolC family outer membrane protein [Chitinimonas arctica]|uniref:TolC family outer membrane protein n=1 Tax=Chitinimonas arctica TaxID=2594795 RepID=UPI0015D24105|nr:TolC family outer membrane protein [Chitinimonas arctica]
MKTRTNYRLALTSLGLSVVTAYAQAPVDLKSAVEQAVLQHPEVRLRHSNLDAAGEEQSAARGAWLPRLDVQAIAGRERKETPTLGSSRSYSHPSTLVELRQTLFDGFATSSEVRRLGHNRQTRYYELLATSDEVALEAARAYIDVLRYRELTELARNNYGTHAEIHGQLNKRVTAGVGRRVDLEQAAGRLALAESNWLTESSNLHDVSARYQRLVGDLPAPTLAKLPPLEAALPRREGFLAETISRNPSFLAAVATIRANRADTDVRRAGRWPTLELRASQTHQRNENGVSGTYRDSAVQLVLNYNLFRGGADNARVRQFEAQLNAAYELRDKTCRDIRQTAQIAFNDIQRLGAQLGLLNQHELSTAKARDAYRQQFDIGQRSLLDLLDTENELFEARRALSNGEYDLQLARVKVLSYSSRLLGALQLRPPQAKEPEQPGGVAEDDNLLRCSTELPPGLTLDKRNLPTP